MEPSINNNRSTLIAQAVRVVCKALSVVLLSRLLTPTEHGLYAMAGSVTLFLLMFRDLGLATAAIQAQSLNGNQRATLCWVHLGLGGTLAGITLALAPLAAWFYATPAVVPMLVCMSPSFLLIGAGTFARAQLARDLRFRELAFIDAAAAVLGTAAMIAAGLADWGAYAFVAFLLVSEGMGALLAWRRLAWRPAARLDLAGIRPLFHTSAHVTGYGLLGYLLQQFDTFAVGQALGARALGLYNRANLLLALPNQHVATPLTDVALATLSRLGVAAPDFSRQACRTVTLIGHFTLPPAAVCIALPQDVVAVVLGAQWPEAAPMLRWLAASAAMSAITNFSYGINVAAGQTQRLVWIAGLTLPLFIATVLLAVGHGATTVALAVGGFNLLLAAPRLYWALRGTPVTLGAYAQALVGPGALATALGLGLAAAASPLAAAAHGARLAVGAAGGAVTLFMLAMLWPRLRGELRYLWTHLPWVVSPMPTP